MTKPRYPEHDKLMQVKDASQAIGDFLDWARDEKEACLMAYREYDRDERKETGMRGDYYPLTGGTEKILAEYFKIDLVRLEKEKRQMIEDCRKASKK